MKNKTQIKHLPRKGEHKYVSSSSKNVLQEAADDGGHIDFCKDIL